MQHYGPKSINPDDFTRASLKAKFRLIASCSDDVWATAQACFDAADVSIGHTCRQHKSNAGKLHDIAERMDVVTDDFTEAGDFAHALAETLYVLVDRMARAHELECPSQFRHAVYHAAVRVLSTDLDLLPFQLCRLIRALHAAAMTGSRQRATECLDAIRAVVSPLQVSVPDACFQYEHDPFRADDADAGPPSNTEIRNAEDPAIPSEQFLLNPNRARSRLGRLLARQQAARDLSPFDQRLMSLLGERIAATRHFIAWAEGFDAETLRRRAKRLH